jgi:Tol biopolymer transport system component
MEFVAGRTLCEEVEARGGLPSSEAIACAVDVCSALSAVHGARLIHRDVKAQNIIRTPDGRTVLMDFGAGEDARAQPRGIEGTPVYLAPELLFGGVASRASEVYAVGVLLYFMLACHYPTTGATIDEVKRAHQRHAAHEPAAALRAAPGLSAIIKRALARRPEDRFPTAEALGEALRALAGPGTGKRTSTFATAASVLTIAVGACLALAATDVHDGNAAGAGPRRVMLPTFAMGLPSRNALRYPFVDRSGRLRYWQPSENPAPVVLAAAPYAAYQNPILSPDGSFVAYTAALSGGAYELRMTDVARRETSELIFRETAYEPIAADWSADGGSLLCWFRQKSGALDLVLISVRTRDVRLLYSVSAGAPPHATLSPDGRYAVTLQPARAGEDWGKGLITRGYLMIVPVDGSRPWQLLADEGEDAFPCWMPDGRRIFFLRPSATVKYSHDGWSVRLGDDLRAEDTRMVVPNVGTVTARAAYTVSGNGELQQFDDPRGQEVYVASFDSESGQIGSPTRIDPQLIGNHVGPSWSPDGRSIAFFSTTPAPFNGGVPLKTLTIKDVETGRIRRLRARLAFLGGYTPQWTRDGTRVVVWGRDSPDVTRTGYYLVDVLSGETEPLIVSGIASPARSQFSPDGLNFLFNDNRTGIVSLDLVTGARKLVLPLEILGKVGRFALSPDGTMIAFTSSTRFPDERWVVKLAVLRQGYASEIARAATPEFLDVVGWTRDNRILFVRGDNPDANPIFEIAPDGGPAQRTDWLVRIAPDMPSISPDGRHVAYGENVIRAELKIVPLPRN